MKTYTWKTMFPIVYRKLKQEKIPVNALVLIDRLKKLNERYPEMNDTHIQAIISKAKHNLVQTKATE